jgi:hypothetical protein
MWGARVSECGWNLCCAQENIFWDFLKPTPEVGWHEKREDDDGDDGESRWVDK